MKCPSCNGAIADRSAWICPYCEHIIDPSVLGDDFLVEETAARKEITRSVVWSAIPPDDGADEDVPDAVILGNDADVDDEGVSLFAGAGRNERSGRTAALLLYTSTSTSRSLRPDAVPVLLQRGSAARTPYEDFVISCIDGHRDVATIHRLSGLAHEEVSVTLLTLVDKRVVELRVSEPPEPSDPSDDLDLVEPQDLLEDDDEVITDAAARPVPRRPTQPAPVQHDPLLRRRARESSEAATSAVSAVDIDGEALDRRERGAHAVDIDLDGDLDSDLDGDLDGDLDNAPELVFEDDDDVQPEGPSPIPLDASLLTELPPSNVAPVPQVLVRGLSKSKLEAHARPASLVSADGRASPEDSGSFSRSRSTARPASMARRVAVQERVRQGSRGASVHFDAALQSTGLASSSSSAAVATATATGTATASPIPTPEGVGFGRESTGNSSSESSVSLDEQNGPVDSVRAMKAAKLFEQALKDRAEGNVISARMNMKLAITFDPTNPLYQDAFDNISKNPDAMPKGSSGPRSKARECYDKATEAENAGDVDQAIEYLEAAVAESRQAAFLNRLGVILAMKKREFSRAQTLIEEAIELAPGNETYARNLQKILSSAATHGQRAAPPADSPGIKQGLNRLFSKLK
ncbi:MAG: tetratricopeptide repeat protein [Deltaproteobacteria bacterium]|nr:tetratricopeptide repeat protein [Deltaproteobacteria bacterium]